MKWIYKILRAIIVAVILLAVLLPAGLFIALSVPRVQQSLRFTAERELTSLLGMDVAIGDIAVAPFSRVALRDVTITDVDGDTAVAADRIGAGVSLGALILRGRMVINYTELIGLDVRLSRDSAGEPLNIQPMIDALSPKDKSKPPTKFDFRVNTVVIRKSSFSYNEGSGEYDTLRFDPRHIAVTDLRADLRLPRMANDNFAIVLRRLAFAECSGLRLEGLDGEFTVTADSASVRGLDLRMPNAYLAFDDLTLRYDSLKVISEAMRTAPLEVGIKRGSYVNLRSLAPFVPRLAGFDRKINISLSASRKDGIIRVADFSIADEAGGLTLDGEAEMRNILSQNREIELTRLSTETSGTEIVETMNLLNGKPLSPTLITLLNNAAEIELNGYGKLSESEGNLSLSARACGLVAEVDTKFKKIAKGYLVDTDLKLPIIEGEVLTRGIPGVLGKVGDMDATFTARAELSRNQLISGEAKFDINSITYAAHNFTDVTGEAVVKGRQINFYIDSDNPGLTLHAAAGGLYRGNFRSLAGEFNITEADLTLFGAKGNLSDCILASSGRFDVEGSSAADFSGFVVLDNIGIQSSGKKPLSLSNLRFESKVDSAQRQLTFESEIADITARGLFTLDGVVPVVTAAIHEVFPSLVIAPHRKPTSTQQLELNATLKSTAELGDIISLPVNVIYPVTLNGSLNSDTREIDLMLDAPYLQQKNKLIENTALRLQLLGDDTGGRMNLYATTVMPTKKGEMTLGIDAYGTADRLDTRFDWKVARERGFYGSVDLSSTFGRDDNRKLSALINVNPSEIVMNDTVWSVSPSTIDYRGNRISVNNFRVGRQGQSIDIDGVAGASPSDSLAIKLRDVNLDYVFETLDIPTAMFGGQATGDFYAAAALSKSPQLYTPGLEVKQLSYNHSLMGDTRILSHWDNDQKAVVISAVVSQPNGKQSKIDGAIMPLSESLDFHFDADQIEVGFMLPFMEAFTSEVSGYASGKARLWGTFKLIDMVGDIYAEDVKLKLDFSNTSYIATDSVHLTPGHIDLTNIHLRDIYGNTAMLNGWIEHEYFKKPRFRFNITDAKSMLVYDVPENSETKWYGRIFGNGVATVTGEPGVVDISVDMQTAANSTFTFVLSDEQQAYDYTFITFRDRDQAKKDSLAAATLPPVVVQELKKRIASSGNDSEPSIYKMNIAVDVTPATQVTLVMDPVGGDRIRAYGSGNLRMTYDSADEDLRMFGTYTLTRGSYNFTLQDIIIKDFTIRDGSSITFQGDPFAAQLNIDAIYSLNANLSDLDESFLQDKEVSRTNVPVHALLMLSGDMRQPDINFDLEFPTLTQDTYRKVRSIVSTEEMMNTQIIYLLALNRFYTPDYMEATKGNELVSVASSTISSQLSNILGQISDNWTIAPAFRSDRGDFSDVEVDLALSSRLLNNRLLLNGNFGYRDKSLNNNAFIGDFDVEYLLNRSGSVRLKAYNRYNDRNFYGRDALTTQGVGVVFKRDFDNIFSFLRRRSTSESASADTTAVVPADTILTTDPPASIVR